jgi:hypothetical protein
MASPKDIISHNRSSCVSWATCDILLILGPGVERALNTSRVGSLVRTMDPSTFQIYVPHVAWLHARSALPDVVVWGSHCWSCVGAQRGTKPALTCLGYYAIPTRAMFCTLATRYKARHVLICLILCLFVNTRIFISRWLLCHTSQFQEYCCCKT